MQQAFAGGEVIDAAAAVGGLHRRRSPTRTTRCPERLGRRPVDRGGAHPGNRARPRRQSGLPAHSRRRRRSTRAPPPSYARRGLLYQVGVPSTTPIATTPTASTGSTPISCSTCRSCARTGWSRCAAGCRRRCDDDDQVPYFLLPALGSGSTLRGYSSWRFRDRHSRALLWRVAMDLRAGWRSTWRCSSTPAWSPPASTRSRCDRIVSDVGHRRAVPRPARDAAADRTGAGPRRAATRSSRRARRSDLMPRRHSRSPRRCCCLLAAGAALVGAGRRLLRRRSAARASPRRRTPSKVAAVGHRPLRGSGDQPVRPAGRSDAATCRAQQRQHHRRSAGLELVHQSHPGARPVTIDEAVTRPAHRQPAPAPGPWTVVVAEAGRASRRGSRCATRAATLWFVSFDAAGYPEAATGAMLVANKIFWTLGYWQVENHLDRGRRESARDRRDGDVHAAVGHGTADATERSRRRLRARAPQSPTAAIARSRRARSPARRSAASATTARGPTIPTTSCRTSTAASCAR